MVQAHALADIEISYEIERIRAWRFRKVSEYMRRLNKDALFSANACRERYSALINGTARIPTELDDDPETRRAELEAFRKMREVVRDKEDEEKRAKEALELKAKEDDKVRHAQNAEEKASKRALKEAEKARRAMVRATEAQRRAQRSLENQFAKAEYTTQLMKQSAEKGCKNARTNKSFD